MTPDDITRLAWSSKIISELAALTCLRVSDEHFDAEVLPREAVMDAVCKIRDATREGEAVIRTLAQQVKAGGVAVYEVQERMSSFAPSSCWTETTRETYEGGYFPETLFHRRILYATPPTHIPDAGNMVSANPPEAGVTEPEWLTALLSEVLVAPMKSNFTLSRDELKHILAPQPKDAP